MIAIIVQVCHWQLWPSILAELPPDGAGLKHPAHISACNAAALIANLAIFTFLGFVFGRLSVAAAATTRERRMGIDEDWVKSSRRFLSTLFSSERGYSNACQYFLQAMAEGQWITVETETGVYLGAVRVHDSREKDSFYLILHNARMYNPALESFPEQREWPAIMFRSDEIKSMALQEPDV